LRYLHDDSSRNEKVPEVQNMEDVLTSSVFGLLKYITKQSIFIHILSYAKTLMGKSLLDCIDFDLHPYTPEFKGLGRTGVKA